MGLVTVHGGKNKETLDDHTLLFKQPRYVAAHALSIVIKVLNSIVSQRNNLTKSLLEVKSYIHIQAIFLYFLQLILET